MGINKMNKKGFLGKIIIALVILTVGFLIWEFGQYIDLNCAARNLNKSFIDCIK